MKKIKSTILNKTIQDSRSHLIMTALFSFFINILMLAGPLYMLQVYDRVLTSNSIDTLIALSIMLLGLFVIMGFLEFVRSRILARLGAQIEAKVSPFVFNAGVRKRVVEHSDDGGKNLSDLTTIRDFLSGNALPAFFDLPWVPVYLLILAILHPLLGLLGLFGVAFLFSVAWFNNWSTRKAAAVHVGISAHGRAIEQASHNNAEVLQAMGMLDSLRYSWLKNYVDGDIHKLKSTELSGSFTILSKTFRLVLQSAALGLGAALVIVDTFTAGAMIAGTIILGRGLAPVDQSIAHWRSYIAAKGAFARLEKLLKTYPEPTERISQRKAQKYLDVERVFAGPPGAKKPIVSGINFSLKAGEAAAILGPSGSGKSTLARLLGGIWMPQTGKIRLDGIALHQWNGAERGQQIGYLPQNVELFEGTIAQNISRFQADASDMEIIAAAEAAGVHETILQMEEGYETNIGDAGRNLSGGGRQRIALARALFRDPFIVILDEPNANLDAEGDLALANAINAVKHRQGIVLIISHRQSIVDVVDKVLVLEAGQQRSFGQTAEILAQITQTSNSNVTPIEKRKIMGER